MSTINSNDATGATDILRLANSNATSRTYGHRITSTTGYAIRDNTAGVDRFTISNSGVVGINNLTSAMLKADASHNIVAAVSNTDYLAVSNPIYSGLIKGPNITLTGLSSGTVGTDSLLTKNPITNVVGKISANYYRKVSDSTTLFNQFLSTTRNFVGPVVSTNSTAAGIGRAGIDFNATTGAVSLGGIANANLTFQTSDNKFHVNGGSVYGSGNAYVLTFLDLTSTALSGTPTAPTAAAGTSTTQIATTAFVQTATQDVVNTATDANYTVTSSGQFVKLPLITANRTVSMPTASTYTGRMIRIWNQNTSGIFSWSFTGATVKDAANNTITTVINSSVYILESDGTNWIKQN
jgi:hypothetical protein